MADKVDLKIMHCPTCGEPLKVERANEPIVCVACCNTIVPVEEKKSDREERFSGSIRVEGIKTSASALAYLEDYFEEYDWKSFAYAQTLSVSQIDALVSNLKSSSADDKNTWIASFRAISIPYLQKINGCEQVLAEVIEAFRKDDMDSYSKFDAYKRITAMLHASKPQVVEKLEKFLQKAAKFGAAEDQVTSLKRSLDSIRSYSGPAIYDDLEQVPEIQSFRREKDQQIAAQLAAAGINAADMLNRAYQLIQGGQYVTALNILTRLKGYANSDKLFEKVDKYFLLSDALEICGKLYYYKKTRPNDSSFALYPVGDGKVGQAPLIRGISRIISNYADVLYYLDSSCNLKKYDFSTGKQEKFPKKSFDKDSIGFYPEAHKVYLLQKQDNKGYEDIKSVYELDLATGGIREIVTGVLEVLYSSEQYLAYTTWLDKENRSYKKQTIVCRLDNLNMAVSLGTEKVSIEDIEDDWVLYTCETPNKNNKDLYYRRLGVQEMPRLLEQNVLEYCKTMAGRIFYYIGTSHNKTMISICPDGTERSQMPMYISNILSEENGWIYFMRHVGYNTAFCKCRVDGTDYKVIARDIDRFVERKNGYMYYIDDSSALVKIRMDGTNKQKLCENVESVLSVKEDKIVFVSVDYRKIQEFSGISTMVKSIYSVEFSGEGKRKLAYDIEEAKEYDENTIFFTTVKKTGNRKKFLNRLELSTRAVQALLEVELEEQGGCYVATAVYGSYDCPQVWTLRRFRDDMLAKTFFGRAFIRLYYAVSPTLVKWFGHTDWFKRMWQGPLDRMVANLRAKGVEDTPYEDKHW